ncbi:MULTISPECIES: peptidoglycan-binding domain-containing protein [Kitasatospora]|uniref:Peptidoglycan binding-like domain-containing protein n=1 Tax=Kitasatospora cystarginea TaxID=58350 RepID=A0ABN3DBW4_9ACTN
MPGEHCAGCGTVRTAGGCACTPVSYGRSGYQPVHPDLEETAVLPHTEGPPLVRPYVPAAAEYEEPDPDAFPTALLPPVPAQDQQATTLLPPVPPQHHPSVSAQQPYPPQYRPAPPQRLPYQAPHRPQDQAAELGVFAFQAGDGPGGRAERRAQQQAAPMKRKVVMAAAGAGIVAIGAGIAFALVPASGNKGVNQADPLPVGTVQPLPTSAASSVPATTAPASDSPSPTLSKASPKPSPTLSRLPVIAKATTTKPTASPSPKPTTASPTPSGPRTLGPGTNGPDVAAMQQQLSNCGYHVRASGSYDDRTTKAVRSFQWDANVEGDPSGVFGPNTRAALDDAFC